jgi:hypothetical protein
MAMFCQLCAGIEFAEDCPPFVLSYFITPFVLLPLKAMAAMATHNIDNYHQLKYSEPFLPIATVTRCFASALPTCKYLRSKRKCVHAPPVENEYLVVIGKSLKRNDFLCLRG